MTKLDLGYDSDAPVFFDPAGSRYLAQSELPNNSYHVLINDTGVLTDPWIKLKLEGTFIFDKPLYFKHDFPRATASVILMEV